MNRELGSPLLIAVPTKRTLAAFLAIEITVMAVAIVLPELTMRAAACLIGLGLIACFAPTRPEYFYALAVFCSGLDYFGIVGTAEHYFVTLFQFALLLAIASYATFAVLNRSVGFPRTRFNLPFLVYGGLATFSLLYAADWVAGAVWVVRFFFLGGLFFLTILVARNKEHLATITFVLLLTVAVVSVIAVYQLVMNKEFLPPELANKLGHGVNRAEGTFANANWMAAFVMIGTIVSFSFLVNLPMRFWRKMAVVILAASSVAALLASFSRSGWLSVFTGIMLVPLLSGKLKIALKLLPLMAVPVLILFITFPQSDVFGSRFQSTFVMGPSNASRICLAISGLWIFLDHPLLGVGIRSFPIVYQKSYVHPDMPLTDVTTSHTLPVEVLAELGIVGFLLLVWLFCAVLREGLDAIKEAPDSYLRALEIGLVASFLALLVNNLFNNNFGDNFLWITMGLIFAARRVGMTLRAA